MLTRSYVDNKFSFIDFIVVPLRLFKYIFLYKRKFSIFTYIYIMPTSMALLTYAFTTQKISGLLWKTTNN